ncbi:MAG: aminotransferase class I/II-fold pyridoxal phosphate-dependent enzyme [Acidobacteriaceae bacterium]|nr:aminotransferase class I/II-fold pyridoxal phosphate-dependent enzyme [Acidobacteriaceae bacterium]
MTNTIEQISKNKVDELAIKTGIPLFPEPVHVGRPNIGSQKAFLSRMQDILDRRWLSNGGPMVVEFERRLQEYLGVRNAICITNATVALELVIRALDLKGEVIVPSFTFIATAHALQWQEITPVFADVESTSHHIDPEGIEKLITPRTTGIIGVHLWGLPCKHAQLQEIADRRGLTLLYDAAHAFGCTLDGQMIGNFGAAEVFSFHATKFFNSFEGGAIATNDDALAERLRLMRNFGFKGYDSVEHIGTNGKMTEASAAMGLTNLDSIDEFMAANVRNYALYQQFLGDLPGCRFIQYPNHEQTNYQYVVLEIDKEKAGIDRDSILRILHSENILARRYFYPGCHRMEPYRSLYPYNVYRLPQTEELVRRVLVLPTGTAIHPHEIEAIASVVRLVLTNPEECRDLLAIERQNKGLIAAKAGQSTATAAS